MAKRNKKVIGIVEMPRSLYQYLCDTSFERAFKQMTDEMIVEVEYMSETETFIEKMKEFELTFRNTAWEKSDD